MLNLPTEIFGDTIVVHAPDELAEEQADEFVAYVTALERSNVIVDLDATESLDSKGLEAIMESREVLHDLQGDLKIATTSKVNRKILEITRLDRQVEIFESVIDAVKSFA
ncbi:MAG: STAS domain-containing protein [Planctomycetales bacterium]|nr:STAS domain-containing protein [Planctomycetales bacterium]